MAFRRSVPQEELRESVPAEQLAKHQTVYQASRGGHFPPTPQQRAHQKVEITVERADK